MKKVTLPVCLIAALFVSTAIHADELTQIIQKDLIALGYDPGNIQGELSTETIVAISKFQAEHNLDVTGEPSPQLAGVIKAQLNARNNPGAGAAGTPAVAAAGKAGPQQVDPAALREAQQACLQEKIEAAQASQKKKRGFGSLMRAVTNTAARFGGQSGLTRQLYETSRDIYDVNATAQDWERAANDLGLSQDELEACRNPHM